MFGERLIPLFSIRLFPDLPSACLRLPHPPNVILRGIRAFLHHADSLIDLGQPTTVVNTDLDGNSHNHLLLRKIPYLTVSFNFTLDSFTEK